MPTSVKVTYLGIEAEGPTLAKAKQAAANVAEKLLSDPDPIIWHYNGYTVVVWGTPQGAAYAYLHGDTPNGRKYGGAYGCRTKEEELKCCRRHIAQLLDDPGALEANDREGLADLLQRRAWNKAYQQAQSEGADSNAAYDWAWHHWKEFAE